MVRIIKQDPVVAGSFGYYYEISGLHGDTKPSYSDIVTGSLFFEVDTGDVYAYDEEEHEWNKVCSLGGDS